MNFQFGRGSPSWSLARSTDDVEKWMHLARAALGRGAAARGAKPNVRIHASLTVVLFCAAAGLGFGPWGPSITLVALISALLAQELPGALIARALGRNCGVRLAPRGAETEVDGGPLSDARRTAAATAGSVCNFLFAIPALSYSHALPGGMLASATSVLGVSHLVWGFAQALPLWPFRAGRGLARRLPAARRFQHAVASAAVTLFGLIVVSRTEQRAFVPVAMLAAFNAIAALSALADEQRDERSGAQRLAELALAKLRCTDSATAAAALAQRALDLAHATALRQRLWTTLAWGNIAGGDPFRAHQAISNLHDDAIDFHLVAAYLVCCNRNDEAVQLLRDARALGQFDREATRLLIEALYRSGKTSQALEVANAQHDQLCVEDWNAIALAIPEAERARMHDCRIE